MGRHTLAGSTATAGRDDVAKLLYRDAMPSHLDERAHDSPNHVPQKAVGRDFKAPRRFGKPHPLRLRERAKRGFHVGSRLAERGKILLRQQPLCRRVHRSEIKRIVHFARIGRKKWIFLRVNIVMVRARGGTEAGMHVLCDRFHALHCNVARQYPIQPIRELLPVKNAIIIEMRHHFPRMDTRIGPASPHRFDRLPQ